MYLTSTAILPLKENIIFPDSVVSITVKRAKSATAVAVSAIGDKLILAVPQEGSLDRDSFQLSDLSEIGTLCQIVQVINLPSGEQKVLLRGLERMIVTNVSLHSEEDCLIASAESVSVGPLNEVELTKKWATTVTVFEEYRELIDFPPDVVMAKLAQLSPIEAADFISAQCFFSYKQKLKLLKELDPLHRLDLLTDVLIQQVGYIRCEKEIREKVDNVINTRHREQYLKEQLRTLQNELNGDENEELIALAEQSGMPEEALERTKKEIERLNTMSEFSPEGTVAKTWIDWAVTLPWASQTEDQEDLEAARQCLNQSHWGLTKVKDRLVEFLAQKALAKDQCPAQVLCLVGPPGVGKTTLGQSVAQALGRKFVSFSMGGMRDESEIRGHRRTYIGSRPGRIIQKLKEAGTNNPVMLLDEVDKLGNDHRGDPASALLEALDPEQNSHFTDHYMEIAFDLSNVIFITTANTVASIPRPLLDRMELIRLPGYLPEEKVHIAQEHLIPRLYTEHGLTKKDVVLSKAAIEQVIHRYTRESGVRSLKRELAKIFRKRSVQVLDHVQKTGQHPEKVTITVKNLEEFLGAPRFVQSGLPTSSTIGYVNGLAWTETGGDVLPIEVAIMKGKESLKLTGNLGDVMKESALAALTYLRSHWSKLTKKSEPDWSTTEIHLHAPEGAVPKDGPSAGLAIATAIFSALTHRPYEVKIAMTGEINLRGEALPIGGLREKILAARRYKLKKVLIPYANKNDFEELESWVYDGLEIIMVKNATEVFEQVLRG